MNEEILSFVQALLEMHNIHSWILEPFDPENPGLCPLPDFDLELRLRLFGREAAEEQLQDLVRDVPPKTVLFLKDAFGCYYVLLRMEQGKANAEACRLLIIGPYVLEAYQDLDLRELSDTLHIPLDQRELFSTYCHMLPATNRSVAFRNLITLLASRIFGGDDAYSEEFRSQDLHPETVFQPSETETNVIRQVELRYTTMGELLQAVREGSAERALKVLVRFRSLTQGHRFSNTLKDARNWLIIFNTQLRTVAWEAGVHPYYLGETSRHFSFLIDALTSDRNQTQLMQQMIRRYCALVLEKNTASYSPTIQQVMVLIHANLQDELSLRSLSAQVSMNAAYLSSLFSREVGMPLTEYINRQRIHVSLRYLNDPHIPVKDIIPQVGIYDMNYYSRLFKKYIGMSPTEYRKRLSGGDTQAPRP